MNYRADIDALRTFAVLAVVIFHFNASLLPGGFAGVDVFFAISGFLMTGIITSGIKKETFSVTKFYISRAKRIIPALSILCLLLMLYGWLKLPPLDYSSLSKHVFSSLLFVSNIVYWSEAGYFDAESHHKWLLHTWSLSAEWQFYIIYPFIILAIIKLMRIRWLGITLIALALVSYVISIYASKAWPTASYFLLPSRAWEMFAGGIAYHYAMQGKSNKSKAMHYIGLVLIICSYFLVSSQDLWPGYKALLPVLGACLYLSANYQGWLSRFSPALLIGKWSYSIYLWHWPVVVYCSLNNVQINIWLGLVLSVALGFLSYQIVEKRRSAKLLTFTPFASAASFFVIISNGYAYQMPKDIYNATMLNPNSNEFGQYTWLKIRELNSGFEGSKHKLLIIGDSTAGDFVNILLKLEVDSKYQIRSRIINAKCGSFYLDEKQRESYLKTSPDITDGLVSKSTCDSEIGNLYNDDAIKQADVIMVSMNWRGYALESLKQSLENLRKNTLAPVYVVGSKGFNDSVPALIYEAYSKNESIGKLAYANSEYQIKINQQINHITKSFKDVYFIDLKSTMCDENKKECIVTSGKNPILYDSLHSTRHGVSYFAEKLSAQLMNL